MKISSLVRSALVGWLAGIIVLLGWSLLWPRIFPVTDRVSAMPGQWKVLLLALVLVTPFGLIGGLIGGRLPYEGGKREQVLYAAISGILLTLVFGSCIFWYSGW